MVAPSMRSSVIIQESVALIFPSAGRGDLLDHQHSRNRIAVRGKMYHRAFISSPGLTMEMPMKATRDIKAPGNSHFHARPRPMSKRAPRTRETIGKGAVLGWSRNISSAAKKNKASRINNRLTVRAVHRMTLIQAGCADEELCIMFSLYRLTSHTGGHSP